MRIMIFNRWKKYPKKKPKQSGRYQCIVRYGLDGKVENPIILDLYYRDWSDCWIDKRRQSVFNGYKVYLSCRASIEDNRVLEDSLCERIDVIAWREVSKVPKRLRQMNNKEKEHE